MSGNCQTLLRQDDCHIRYYHLIKQQKSLPGGIIGGMFGGTVGTIFDFCEGSDGKIGGVGGWIGEVGGEGGKIGGLNGGISGFCGGAMVSNIGGLVGGGGLYGGTVGTC